jgi:hypothetical protein
MVVVVGVSGRVGSLDVLGAIFNVWIALAASRSESVSDSGVSRLEFGIGKLVASFTIEI